jgi:hypothetical protein
MAALVHDLNLRSSDLHMQGIDIKLSPLSTVQEDQEILSPVRDLVAGLRTHFLVFEKCRCVITSYSTSIPNLQHHIIR